MDEADIPAPTFVRRFGYLAVTLFYFGILIGLLVLIDRLVRLPVLDYFAPYKQYLTLADVAIFGWLTVGAGSRWVHSVTLQHTSPDTAGAMRILFRIFGSGVLLASIVSLLTSSSAAALTMGSFTGLVVGYATQTVLGNTVAGVFLALFQPIKVGDNVTVGGNSGKVMTITLMHTVLDAEDRVIMIPSASIAGGVLIRHKSQGT